MIRLALTAAAAALLVIPWKIGHAHDAPSGMRYDGWCCNGNNHTGDCEPIPSTSVRETAGGYVIAVKPGDHRLVTRPHTFQKLQSETRWSTDGQYHLCLYPSEDQARCFYAPMPGV